MVKKNENKIPDEVQRMSAYCVALIGFCRKTNAETMTIKQEGLTYLGKPIGDWEVIVRKVETK